MPSRPLPKEIRGGRHASRIKFSRPLYIRSPTLRSRPRHGVVTELQTLTMIRSAIRAEGGRHSRPLLCWRCCRLTYSTDGSVLCTVFLHLHGTQSGVTFLPTTPSKCCTCTTAIYCAQKPRILAASSTLQRTHDEAHPLRYADITRRADVRDPRSPCAEDRDNQASATPKRYAIV